MPLSPQLWGYAVVLVLPLLLFALSCLRSYRRLSHIPGPTGWGVSVFPWVRVHFQPDLMEQYRALSTRYGPLVRVAPNTLITSDAETIRKMSAAHSAYRRSLNYYAMRLNPGQDHVFSTRDEHVHNDLRKKMSAGYSGKENRTLERDVDDAIRELCHLIDRKYISEAGDQKPMDVARKIGFLALDIISKAAFDFSFHDVRDDRDNYGYMAEIEKLFPNITWTAPIPGMLQFLTDIGLLQYAASRADGAMGVEKVKRLAYAQVEERFEADGTPKPDMPSDMLGSFIRHGLTRAEAKEESVLNLTSGSDTVSSTMRAILLNVITSPRISRRLTAEIDDAITKGVIPAADEVIPDTHARELPYLQAVIKEGLRWYPAVAAELSKVTPPQGDTICGFFVPGGTKVGCSVLALHRNETLFGPDANTFRPERWLLSPHASPADIGKTSDVPNWSVPAPHPLGHETDPARLYAMLRNNDLVFGSGRMQCLGKSVALMELNKIFVELFKRYEFDLMNVLEPWRTRCCGTHIQRDMWVTVRRRSKT